MRQGQLGCDKLVARARVWDSEVELYSKVLHVSHKTGLNQLFKNVILCALNIHRHEDDAIRRITREDVFDRTQLYDCSVWRWRALCGRLAAQIKDSLAGLGRHAVAAQFDAGINGS